MIENEILRWIPETGNVGWENYYIACGVKSCFDADLTKKRTIRRLLTLIIGIYVMLRKRHTEERIGKRDPFVFSSEYP